MQFALGVGKRAEKRSENDGIWSHLGIRSFWRSYYSKDEFTASRSEFTWILIDFFFSNENYSTNVLSDLQGWWLCHSRVFNSWLIPDPSWRWWPQVAPGEVQVRYQEKFLLRKSSDAVAQLPRELGVQCPWRCLRTMEMWHWGTWLWAGVGLWDLRGLFHP